MRPFLPASLLTSGQNSLSFRRQLQESPGSSEGLGSAGAGVGVGLGLGGVGGIGSGLVGARGLLEVVLVGGGGIGVGSAGNSSCCLVESSILLTHSRSSRLIGRNIGSDTGLPDSGLITFEVWLEPRQESRPGGSPPLPVSRSHLLLLLPWS